MNYFKRSFPLRDPINVPSSTKTTSPLNNVVRFNDTTSTSKKMNEREKYLTA